MVDLSNFTSNRKILSKIEILSYNQFCPIKNKISIKIKIMWYNKSITYYIIVTSTLQDLLRELVRVAHVASCVRKFKITYFLEVISDHVFKFRIAI